MFTWLIIPGALQKGTGTQEMTVQVGNVKENLCSPEEATWLRKQHIGLGA